MMKITKKELFSIPNILGYFRIALIPLFMYLYLNAESAADYYKAAFVIFVSGITDLLDGKIARKFDMITELGKVLDPVADKLTHGSIALCLVFKIKEFYWVAILFIAKELFMVIGNLASMKLKGRKLDGAKWYGKVMTTILYVCLYLLIAFPRMSVEYQMLLTNICMVSIVAAWLLYIPVFYGMITREKIQE